MNRILIFYMVGLPFFVGAGPAAPAASSKERLLFRKPLGDDREIVVVQGPDRPIADAKELFSSSQLLT